MRKKFIALLLAMPIAFGAISTKTVKASSFDEIYQSAYNCAVQLQQLGKDYNITPRLSTNGSKMEDNNLRNVVLASEQMQKTINELRYYQHQFPDTYWKARNTFSEIGDGYQQPIYEWIVDIAVRLQKELQEVNSIPKNQLDDFIANTQYQINSANILNEGVDPAYKGAYQAALDDLDANLDKIRENLDKIKEGSWVNDIKKPSNQEIKIDNSRNSYSRYTLQLATCLGSAGLFAKSACRYERDGCTANEAFYYNYKELVNDNYNLKQLAKEGIPKEFIQDYKVFCKSYDDILKLAKASFNFNNDNIAISTNENKIRELANIINNTFHYKLDAESICEKKGFNPYE